MTLTAKQQRFVSEYLIDLNATQAAIRAGYSPETAYSQGARLLKNVEVEAAIAEAQGRRAERARKSADDVEDELESIAFMDLEAPEAPGVMAFWRPEHKLKALHLLALRKGMLRQKVEHSGADGAPLQVVIRKYGKEDE
jgi:phage terminase small subunit